MKQAGKPTIAKGHKLTLRVDSIAAGGQGFCKHEGFSIFVDRGVPGDLAELELYDVRKDFAHAKISRLLEASPSRQDPPCKLFKVCGGCQWQHIKYAEQLRLKADMLKQVVKHIGGLSPDLVLEPLAAEEALHYRNKVQYPVSSPHNSSRILAGYYEEGSHKLVNIKHCPVQPELLDQILETAKSAAENSGFSTYDEKKHSGLIRHFIARYSFSENEILFTLVLNLKAEAFNAFAVPLGRFADELMEKFPQIKGVCANLNTNRGNRIMGAETKTLKGQNFLIEKLSSKSEKAPQILKDGIRFKLSPASFFQVNSRQAVRLMDLIFEAISAYSEKKNLQEIPLILDAFAGVASIASWVSALAEKVIAVEESTEAVKDAGEILSLNSISNVQTICGTVEKVFPQLLADGIKPQVLILDPPRKGVDREALSCTAKLNPELIIYVSCNPSTLARDLKILQEHGYKTLSIQPVDLFPQTYHLESVTLLERT